MSLVCESGLFVYNISYTLAPEGRFPQGVIDCVEAFNWIFDNAEKYNLDTSRIVVGGDSAGGYYTSSIGAVCVNPHLREIYGVTPKGMPAALVLNCGVYDVELVLKSKMIFNMTKTICEDLFGLPLAELDKFPNLKEVSTLAYVNEKFPPCYVVWAKKDMFCKGQGQLLAEKLRDLGVYCEDYGGCRFIDNHVFPLFWFLKSAKESNAKLRIFLEKIKNKK